MNASHAGTTDTGADLTALSKLGEDSLAIITTRASMKVRTAQAARTAPVVLISLVALLFSLHGRVDSASLRWWATLIASVTIARTILCYVLRPRIDAATPVVLRRYEGYLFVSAVINAVAVGATYYMVARTGDLTVRLVITLICCFYGIGTLVNASSHLSSFLVVSSINFGTGIAFWLGMFMHEPAHIEVAIPFLAIALLVLAFGRENAQQFRDSLRIRTENISLLESLAAEKRVVERALEDVRLASESKSRFLAAASHDLRQPLHALTMFLGTLSFHVTTDDARRLLRRVKDTAVVLEQQFNSLLDLSKFDVGAVQAQIKPFRLDRLIERIVEEFRPEAEAKHLAISAGVIPVVGSSDVILIERVLRNLVGNAVKYTVSGSVIVRLSLVSGNVFVEVCDTGPGIPEEQQKRVFEEYVQLANPARQRRHGVGLGLAIVRRIDALLELRLFVNSTVGLGSTFGFHVPAADQHLVLPHIEQHVEETTSFRTSATIWILDDDPDVVEALQEQLLAWGADVRSFASPAALLQQLHVGLGLPHWILTDDMLGSELSGLETAQILATEFHFIRVCLITGNTEPRRLAQLRASGFPLIVKPAQPEALMQVIRDRNLIAS